MHTAARIALTALALLVGTWCHAQEPAELARRARAVLEKHCHRCHGKNGSAEGKFAHVLDRNRLVEAGTVVPGTPNDSKLLRRMLSPRYPMPPREEDDGTPITVRPTDAEREAVRAWIAAGAPDFVRATPPRRAITSAAIFAAIVADLEKAPSPAEQQDRRYLSLAHEYNAGHSDDELTIARNGLAKLINSLSWRINVVVPQPVDAEKTLFRIRLSDYGWTAQTWEQVVAANPYDTRLFRASAVQAARRSGTAQPVVRADWFVEAASRPPLYHDVLGLPSNATELERILLGSEAGGNSRVGQPRRAGFNGSGVSNNNRLIERLEIPRGRIWREKGALYAGPAAYWRSFDFARNVGRQNLFAFPLGPGDGPSQFRHDGGEIIFNLPNGLQAYLLVGAKNNRIDEGPINIVSDRRKNAPSVTVVNGVSCMSCHAAGMIFKDDEIRQFVETTVRKGFETNEIVNVLSLYPRREEFRKLLQEDGDRFLAALKRTGTDASKSEPISAVVGLFGREVDVKLAAVEVGLPPAEFRAGLEKATGDVRRLFGALLVGGTVKREVFTRHFHDLETAVSAPH